MIRFVLCWDIDGTLLTTARAGIAAWEGSFAAVAGRPLVLEELPTAGLTDVEIATHLASGIGDTSATTVQKILSGYEDRLPASLPLRQGAVLPGITAVLEALQAMPSVYSLLLTGNTRRGAAAKLTQYGLSQYFTAGAFSDGLPDRPSIARRAKEIVEQQFGADAEREYFVIGDTPHDIHCGTAIGAKTVSVCTGNYDRNALSQHKPWLILDSLADKNAFFSSLGLVHA